MIIIKELELKQFLKLFWDRKLFIIIVMVVFAIMGWAKVEYFTTPVYEASGKLICARNEETIQAGATVTSSELTMPSSLSDTYAELIKSDLVVNKVIQNLGLNMTAGQLSSNITLTPLTRVYYQISAKSVDKEKAAEIANEFIKVFSAEIKEFYEIDNIYVVDNAEVPTSAINMNVMKSIKIFTGIGFVVAAAAVMIMFIFNNTVTNSDQIKRYTKLTTLASIPRYSGNEDLITLKDSKSPYAESIKILRTNLQYMYDKGDLQTVAITSSLPGEGKSWLTANLAVAFANTGKKTLIIDADMRRGRQHRLFKVRKVPGLSEFLRSTFGSTDMIALKGRKSSGKGRGLFKFGKKDKDMDYMYDTGENKARFRSLKMETDEEEIEIEMEPEKKTRGRRAAVKEDTKEKTRRKRTIKKEVEEESPKKTKRRTTKKVADEEEDVEEKAVKKSTRKTTEKAAEKDMDVVDRKKVMQEEEEEPTIFEYINETGIDNLYVLPSGSERLESSELLSTNKLEEALQELKEEFDMIIVDTPPVSVVADGFIISRIVDTNMIVLKHGNTEINELNKIKNNIHEIGGEVIGTVINKIPDANKKYYNTYYNKKVK